MGLRNFWQGLRDSIAPAHHPGAIPQSPIVWPTRQDTYNRIQQTKGSAKPQVSNIIPTTQPNRSQVQPRTTPPHVSNVRVVLRPSAGQKQVTVQFNHPFGSPYFQGANIYLRQAGQQPTLVAGGAKSPLTFAVANHPAPHAIYVTSFGPWGETNVLTSPSHHVKLS
jgi:hypothetical protein